jgi:large subunit ribosomal protein L9
VEVILLRDVENVGLRGDVVNVARGYMRNYLQPRKLAEPATPALVAELSKREEQRARHEARTVEQAHEVAESLSGVELRFERSAGPRGRLFGSVTPTDIADEIWSTSKIRVDRRKMDLPETIKRVGRHTVPITIFEDVKVEVPVLVVPEGGELPSEDEIAAWEAEERAEAEPEEGEVEGAEELEALLAEEDAPEPEAAAEDEGHGDEPAPEEEPAGEPQPDDQPQADVEQPEEPGEEPRPDEPQAEAEQLEESPEADEPPATDEAEEPAPA